MNRQAITNLKAPRVYSKALSSDHQMHMNIEYSRKKTAYENERSNFQWLTIAYMSNQCSHSHKYTQNVKGNFVIVVKSHTLLSNYGIIGSYNKIIDQIKGLRFLKVTDRLNSGYIAQ